MKRARRRFGPLFYATLGVALLVLASRPFWEMGSEHFRAWQLVGRLADQGEPHRRQATQGLVQLGPVARPWVIRAMRSADPQVRCLACSILVQTAPERSREALAALQGAVKDGDPQVRAAAVRQLESIVAGHGSEADEKVKEGALREIVDALGDDSSLVRHHAGRALFNLGPTARPAVSNLDRALDGLDKPLRVLVARAYLQVDREASRTRVIAALSALVTDKSIRREHYELVRILIDAQGEEATATMLIPLINHPDLETRLQAIHDLTLQCSSAKALRPAMIDALGSADIVTRDEAAFFLLKHEPAMAPRAIDLLAERIADSRYGRFASLHLIGKTRHASSASMKPLVTKLVELLARAPNPASRAHVIVALGQFGPDARPAAPALLELSKSSDLSIATRAVASLAKIDGRFAETGLPSLLDWMTPGHDSAIRVSAIASLGEIGPAAAPAIPALLTAADESDATISASAVEAIAKIDPMIGRSLKRAIANRAPQTNDDQPQ